MRKAGRKSVILSVVLLLPQTAGNKLAWPPIPGDNKSGRLAAHSLGQPAGPQFLVLGMERVRGVEGSMSERVKLSWSKLAMSDNVFCPDILS